MIPETSKREPAADEPRKMQKKLRIELTFTNANLFAANSVNHYVALRMDTLKIAADKISVKCSAEESSLKVVQNEGPYYQVGLGGHSPHVHNVSNWCARTLGAYFQTLLRKSLRFLRSGVAGQTDGEQERVRENHDFPVEIGRNLHRIR